MNRLSGRFVIAVSYVIAAAGCGASGYGPCSSVKVGTNVAQLPTAGARPFVEQLGGIIEGDVMLPGRCRVGADAGVPIGCDAQYFPLGGQYVGSSCHGASPSRVMSCGVFAVDGGVVGVWAYCLD